MLALLKHVRRPQRRSLRERESDMKSDIIDKLTNLNRRIGHTYRDRTDIWRLAPSAAPTVGLDPGRIGATGRLLGGDHPQAGAR